MGRSFGNLDSRDRRRNRRILVHEGSPNGDPDWKPPKTTVDVVGVRNDLMAIANAERRYWVMSSDMRC